MAKMVNISAARRDLPSLFDRVTTNDGDKVVIRRRDGGREAVLVSRDYVERLERANRRLGAGSAFRLVGSGEVLSSIEDAIADIRADDKREADHRIATAVPRPERK